MNIPNVGDKVIMKFYAIHPNAGGIMKITLDHLNALFESRGISPVALDPKEPQASNNIKFSIHGPRNSVILYTLYSDGHLAAWFGKSNSDSGGRAVQGSVPEDPTQVNRQTKKILNLHKRFMQSGRRKVLRNFKY